MPLDAQMAGLRQTLAEFEIDPPTELRKFLPLCDGHSGKCCIAAEWIVWQAGLNSGLVLVHGKCRSIGKNQDDHAWVEVPGGLVYDAVLGRVYPWADYQKTLMAVVSKRYNAKQVAALTRSILNCGPWTEEEEKEAFAHMPLEEI